MNLITHYNSCTFNFPSGTFHSNTSFTLSADFLNGFASLLSKDPRGIFLSLIHI